MQLSQRLSSVASMVTAGNCLADVGTDHGYVPIYLYERNVIPHAIAMDVNKGPLERAKLHIAEYGFENAIETRLSDGLAALNPGEAQSIVIAGMGGPLTVRILSAHPEVTASAKELILQPQSEVSEVRRFLDMHGWEIIEERMVKDAGKYYPMMKSVYHPEKARKESWTYIYGDTKIQKNPEILSEYLKKDLEHKRTIIAKLYEENTKRSRMKAKLLAKVCKNHERVLGFLFIEQLGVVKKLQKK